MSYETDVNPYKPVKSVTADEVIGIVDEALHAWVNKAHVPYGEFNLTSEDLWYIGMVVRTALRDKQDQIERHLQQGITAQKDRK